MKIYLDDKRDTPEGWTRCYWPAECIELLEAGDVEEISLDHDLGDIMYDFNGNPMTTEEVHNAGHKERTGYDVLVWIQEQVFRNKYVPPVIKVHSDNGPAVQSMKITIERIRIMAMANEEGDVSF